MTSRGSEQSAAHHALRFQGLGLRLNPTPKFVMCRVLHATGQGSSREGLGFTPDPNAEGFGQRVQGFLFRV